jgi:DEAD/DEAH box helicase domain-containing protein
MAPYSLAPAMVMSKGRIWSEYQGEASSLVPPTSVTVLGFAICTRCGYAESEHALGKERSGLPKSFLDHTALTRLYGRCWKEAESPVLRNHHLAALHNTDLLQLDFGGLVEVLRNDEVVTLGCALKLAGAEMLELDHRELGVVSARVGVKKHWGLHLFDTTGGGSGHVLELFENGTRWLQRTVDVMFRDEEHNARCETACIRCLLTTSSQLDYEKGNLQRKRVITILKALLRGT